MKKTTLSEQALEMIMRDVLDGMSDFSLHAAYSAKDFGMEILTVEPANQDKQEIVNDESERPLADVIFPPQFRKAVG
ncbi:MAG TPA: integration host factor subunit beta [Chromatiales bacterium]|nr:integration host factor subunit beta [Chromatiales bacterium]